MSGNRGNRGNRRRNRPGARRVGVVVVVLLFVGLGAAVGGWLVSPGDGPVGVPAAAAAAAGPAGPGAVSSEFPVGLGNPDLSGAVRPFGNGSPSPVPPGVDGCDRNYVDAGGALSVCVPSVVPDGGAVDCASLRRLGFGPLRVVGADVKQLAGPGRQAAVGEVVCGG